MKARILKKFEDEIHQLEKELKTELPKEIQRARELGDLRENAEYAAAKERQRLVEARISMLKKRVSEISLMNLDKIPTDKVGFGSTVHLKLVCSSLPLASHMITNHLRMTQSSVSRTTLRWTSGQWDVRCTSSTRGGSCSRGDQTTRCSYS